MKKNRKQIIFAGKTGGKKVMAGVVGILLCLCLAAGIWGGSADEVYPNIDALDLDAKQMDIQKDTLQISAETEEQKDDGEVQKNSDAQSAAGSPQKEEEKNRQNTSDPVLPEDTSGSLGGVEEKRQYEVGDVMEDGSMYTGGDVEAGLDYIRENPQIWDQIVWH